MTTAEKVKKIIDAFTEEAATATDATDYANKAWGRFDEIRTTLSSEVEINEIPPVPTGE